MLTEGDQRSWIKIEVTGGKTASKCYHRSRQACGDNALPYRRLDDGSKSFVRVGMSLRICTAQVGSPFLNIRLTLRGLLSIDRLWTVRELSVKVCLSHQTVRHVLKKWPMSGFSVYPLFCPSGISRFHNNRHRHVWCLGFFSWR
ncbi:hypothetical protein AVEN_204351-1 [Araneus ventricosus]|uniref:Uncharacterized protein n=1 Tax=Araneus ventricosus TaxID=182803 RepID=A0A4Y2QES3_ARAVE|nr:hypothetical protein AVEN_204351-1 [Araneus ventricosus]